MACNNTTYMELINNSTELQNDFLKYKFIVNTWNHNVPMAMMVNKCVTPVWIIIGVFGNVISALVWANPRMRTCNTAAYYLTCLAVADLTFLILHLIYELENPWLLGTLDVYIWCQIFSMSNMAVQYLCVFLVLAFTVERFLSVCHPFKAEKFGKTRTPRTIFFLFLTSLLLSFPHGYFWDISLVGECVVRMDEFQPDSFFSIYTWCTELAIFGVIPLIVLLLNVAVLYKVRTVGQLRVGKPKHLAYESRQSQDSSMSALVVDNDHRCVKRFSGNTNGGYNANYKGTTVTLLWVSFYLIFTMLPNTVLYAMQANIPFGPMPCLIEEMAGDVSMVIIISLF
uniref:G-protein coupled receptors family 1 profile domain-containing protein n=1 Tax=Biomphalaria glabrata TaxID=6526 RepID=A0A2C9KKW9_BIOGL